VSGAADSQDEVCAATHDDADEEGPEAYAAATVYADPEDAAGAEAAYTRIANAERAADAARAKVPR